VIGEFSYPGIGPLELVETYEFYDEPVLYVCRDHTDRLYLGALAADEQGRKVWLYAPLSPQRHRHVRSGGMDLFNAFRSVEGGTLLRVVVRRDDGGVGEQPEAEWVAASTVSDDMLPVAGEMLDLDTVRAHRKAVESGTLTLEQSTGALGKNPMDAQCAVPAKVWPTATVGLGGENG
jgi:hypothetical protein